MFARISASRPNEPITAFAGGSTPHTIFSPSSVQHALLSFLTPTTALPLRAVCQDTLLATRRHPFFDEKRDPSQHLALPSIFLNPLNVLRLYPSCKVFEGAAHPTRLYQYAYNCYGGGIGRQQCTFFNLCYSCFRMQSHATDEWPKAIADQYDWVEFSTQSHYYFLLRQIQRVNLADVADLTDDLGPDLVSCETLILSPSAEFSPALTDAFFTGNLPKLKTLVFWNGNAPPDDHIPSCFTMRCLNALLARGVEILGLEHGYPYAVPP
jgi:hypothetical protein